MDSSLTVDEVKQAGFAKTRSLIGYLMVMVRGFVMGSADVVPGVSGGTMAFILGIYEELINSIRMVARPPFIQAVTGWRFQEALKLINYKFLISLFVGIGIAVLTLAPLIEWMLVNEPVILWSFFFGSVVASVATVMKRVEVWGLLTVVALVLGSIGAYVLVGLVPVQTPVTWWFLLFSGAIAICAMILPGISGSFILVLLGKYQFFVSAVNDRNLVPLFWAGIGAVIGIVTFAQLLGWLFRRYHDITVALLIGFMIGSLRKVWPWKEVLESMTGSHGEVIPLIERNVLPALTVNGAFNNEIITATLVALVGFGIVLALDFVANRKETA